MVAVAGPGSGLSEEPAVGVRAGRAGVRVVSLLPSRARRDVRGQVGEHGAVNQIGQPAFQARMASIEVLPSAFLRS